MSSTVKSFWRGLYIVVLEFLRIKVLVVVVQNQSLFLTQLNIEVLPPASSHDPPHLDEAVSLKLYEMHMAPKPPSPSEEEEQTESQETNVCMNPYNCKLFHNIL